MIEFRHVTRLFGDGATAVKAVDDLSFVCPPGAFWAIMGPSGSGKSTVLHLIAGLTPPTSGTVLVEGQDVARMTPTEAAAMRRRRVGYVMQAFNLLPFLSAAENVGMPLVLDGVKPAEVAARVGDALAQVNMSRRAAHRPSQLSGGEQQRVAVARALVTRPAILLADEPTGNLDRSSGRAVIDLLVDIHERTGLTIMLVTHDPVFASYAGAVHRLVDGKLDQQIDFEDEPSERAFGRR